MTITGVYSANSANTTLFRLIRTFESGSPAGDYSLNTGNGAYGAYQMRARALKDAGAIKSASVSLTNSSNWTGTFGNSLDDFLGTPSNQDGAAAAYLDKYVVPALDRTGALFTVGTSFTDSSGNTEWITLDGLLLAAWNIPGAAVGIVNGTASAPRPGTAQYTDTLSRFQAGAMVDGLSVSDPTARAASNSRAVISNGSSVTPSPKVPNIPKDGQNPHRHLNLLRRALFKLGLNNEDPESDDREDVLREEEERLRQILWQMEALRDRVDSNDPSLDPDEILDTLNSLMNDIDGLDGLASSDLLDRLRGIMARISDWIETASYSPPEEDGDSVLDESDDWDEEQEEPQPQFYSYEEDSDDDPDPYPDQEREEEEEDFA